jgi:hypothetical protein
MPALSCWMRQKQNMEMFIESLDGVLIRKMELLVLVAGSPRQNARTSFFSYDR